MATQCLSSHQSHTNLSNKTTGITPDRTPQREELEHPQHRTNSDPSITLLTLSIFLTRKEIKDTRERRENLKERKRLKNSKERRNLSQRGKRDSTSLSSKHSLKSSNTELKETPCSKTLRESKKLPRNLRTIKLKIKQLTLWPHREISQALL